MILTASASGSTGIGWRRACAPDAREPSLGLELHGPNRARGLSPVFERWLEKWKLGLLSSEEDNKDFRIGRRGCSRCATERRRCRSKEWRGNLDPADPYGCSPRRVEIAAIGSACGSCVSLARPFPSATVRVGRPLPECGLAGHAGSPVPPRGRPRRVSRLGPRPARRETEAWQARPRGPRAYPLPLSHWAGATSYWESACQWQ